MKTRHIYITILFLLTHIAANAQNATRYHIDKYNGLPSNHVYRTLTDRFGYLWLATEKGVIRYNGYEFKKFGLAEGLSNDDVWDLYEDKKGRIWLMSIVDEIGYIKDNSYRKTIIINDHKELKFKPRDMRDYPGGVFFLSPSNDYTDILIEYKGAIMIIDLSAFLDKPIVFNDNLPSVKCMPDNFYEIYFNGTGLSKRKVWEVGNNIFYKNIIDNVYNEKSIHVPWLNYLISFKYKDDTLIAINPINHSMQFLPIKKYSNADENIYRIFPDDNYLCIVTHSYIYKLDSNFHLVNKMYINDYVDSANHINGDLAYYSEDATWDQCFSTYNHGVYINFLSGSHYHLRSTNIFNDFRYIGNISDTVGFWWRKDDSTLMINGNNSYKFYHHFPMSDIKKILYYNSLTPLIVSGDRGNNLWFNYEKNSYKYLVLNNVHKDGQSSIRGWKDVIVDSLNSMYICTSSGGFCNIIMKEDSIYVYPKDRDAYTGIAYDSATRLFWVYNEDKVLLYRRDGRKVFISRDLLSYCGIKKIEKILIDSRSRDIFIKDYKGIYVFNYREWTFKRILNSYNLENSKAVIYKHKLVVAGSLGILFSRIRSDGELTEPVVYANTKHIYYNFLKDYQVSGNTVLLSTDKGAYSVEVPTDSMLDNSTRIRPPYRFLLMYDSSLRSIRNGDTIKVLQSDLHFQFDVINPVGSGQVHYQCYLEGYDNGWHELLGSEYSVPQLGADHYYTLLVSAYDDASRSTPVRLQVYIVPYWWQTVSGKRLLWAGGILLVLILGGIVVLITKRVVTKSTEKKNKTLELELKSIYSQINPHFVFNSLSAALYFIRKKKMDEAYVHISKFSKLLRAYIKSSRNKFVQLPEEITNLRNYIELQQTRFEDKFDYEIAIEDKLPQERVYMPSLLLQPIVENAINHGLFHRETKGRLKVSFRMDAAGRGLVCEVEDNGIGRKRSKELNAGSLVKAESYGDHLIRDLIRIINEYEKMQIGIEYIDKEEPETGTIVVLTIQNAIHNE